MTDGIGVVYDKKKLSCHDRSDRVLFVIKIRQNVLTKHTSAIYAKIDIELSWPIGLSSFVTKTIQDNDVTNCKSVVNAKNNTELSWPIESSVECDEN